MSSQAKSNHYFSFFGTVTGLTTSNFSIAVFTKDGVAVDADTRNSFAIVEISGGYYYAKYIPSDTGLYFLAITNVANSVNVSNIADVQAAPNVVNLSQDTGGTNSLQPGIPDITIQGLPQQPDISEYILMVFQSSDWQVGRVDNSYAVAMTQLDSQGNWLTTPLSVLPNTYHIIIRNNYGTTKVIQAYLEV